MFLSLLEIRQMNPNDTVLVSKVDILMQMTRCTEEKINFRNYFLGKALPVMFTCERKLSIKNHGIYYMNYIKASIQDVLDFFGCTKNKVNDRVFLTQDSSDYTYTTFLYNNMEFIQVKAR